MKNPNQYVESYLKEYLSSNFHPGFAVMLQGEWGCGKTWFIKNYIEECSKKNAIGKLIYITLYGVSKTQDIMDQVFNELHPILAKKEVAFAGKILKGFAKATLKIDFDHDGKTDGSIDMLAPEIKLPDYLTNLDKCVLIFDDFERCNLDLTVVLGYINSFVEHQNLKAIIIANEDELNKIESQYEEKIDIYKKVKEKLIGKTLKIHHNVDNVFDSFLKEFGNHKFSALLQKHKSLIIEIYKDAEFNNLRHLKQCLWDLSIFYKKIPSKYISHDDLMSDLFSIFFAFSFEIKNGLDVEEIKEGKSYSIYSMLKSEGKDDVKPKPIEKVIEKYDFLKTFDLILSLQSWYRLFKIGFLNPDTIETALNNSKYFIQDNQEPWITLWHYREIDDETFKKQIKKLNSKIENKEYYIPGDILQVFGVLLRFSEIDLIQDKIAEVLSKAKGYIDSITDKIEFKKFCTEEFERFEANMDSGWKSLGYPQKETDEFKEIYHFLIDKMEETRINTYPEIAEKLLENLKSDPQKFCIQMYLNDHSENPFYKSPILSSMKIDSFLSIFYKLSSLDQKDVAASFRRRFKYSGDAKLLLKELAFIQSIKEQILDESDKHNRTLYGLNLKEISSYTLENICNELIKLQSTT